MRMIRKLAGIFITLLIVSSCAGAPVKIPDKYDLDSQLEKVPDISKFNMMSWDRIDSQSFVLQTTPSEYYLIVLSSPAVNLPFAESIHISSTGSMVRPGFNNVQVIGDGIDEDYVINKIYKFKDYEQVKSIKAQLSGERK
jgi:hypothetical protein